MARDRILNIQGANSFNAGYENGTPFVFPIQFPNGILGSGGTHYNSKGSTGPAYINFNNETATRINVGTFGNGSAGCNARFAIIGY